MASPCSNDLDKEKMSVMEAWTTNSAMKTTACDARILALNLSAKVDNMEGTAPAAATGELAG